MAGKKTRDELIDILNLVVDKVTSNLNIDEILLYGSYAKGKEYEPYIQLVAFPSRTYYEEEFIKPEFIQEIKNTGKLIYKKNFEIDILKAFS
jgi:predicted nucleotidyltransferase